MGDYMSNRLNGRGIEQGYAPFYGVSTEEQLATTVDESGAQQSRAQVLTDEGGYRVNFANSSLAVSIGTCTFTNGSNIVSGTGLSNYDLHNGDYIYLNADGVTAQAHIDYFTDTKIILEKNYTGAGGTGASSRQLVASKTGTGQTISVASGACTITLGNTTGATAELERDVDMMPIDKTCAMSISQRVANQDIYAGFYNEAIDPTNIFAWFHFNGTTNTTVICETGRNPTTAPSVAETQSTTITLPSGLTTATSNRYRVSVLQDRVVFSINDTIVAAHQKVVPLFSDLLTSTIRGINGTTPTTGTSIVVDYDYVRNFNSLMIETSSTAITINDDNVPITDSTTYNASGVITINTVLATFDCSQVRSVFVSGQAGTTGAITPEFYNEITTTWVPVALIPALGGAIATTISTTTGLWMIPVTGKTLRFRLSTATTAGNTQLVINGSRENIAIAPTTIAATQSGTWNIGTVTPGTAATNLGKAEDAAHTSADVGIEMLGVRTDSLVLGAGANTRYGYIALDKFNAQLVRSFEKQAKTYRAATAFATTAGALKDFFEIFGNATTTVVVTGITITGYATAATQWLIAATKRSTANTAGTKAALTAVPLDSTDSASSSIPQQYSVDPTAIGASVGDVDSRYVNLNAGAASTGNSSTFISFGDKGKGVLLSGVTQGLCIRTIGAAPAGTTITITIEWYEF